MPLNDWEDVAKARMVADEAADRADNLERFNSEERLRAMLNAHRLELRALGVTISYAIDEAIRAR